MPTWITDMGAATVFPVLAALVILAWAGAKMWHPLSKVVRFLDSLIGAEDNPGLLDRMKALEADVRTIHHEVTPNSGGSMKDAVGRIETYQRDQGSQITTLTGRFEEHLTLAERRDSRIDDLADAMETLVNPTEPA
ncbi:MAG TPA: hypothetical protein VIO38_08970 [Rariglobus sp.]